jgi:hypothetical protein
MKIRGQVRFGGSVAGLGVSAEEAEDPQAGETFRENHPVVALKLWFFVPPLWVLALGSGSGTDWQGSFLSLAGPTSRRQVRQDLQLPSRRKPFFRRGHLLRRERT